ncbi:hypothetical protein [Nocardioides mangrovi]|uniref:WXG100 family type VII secretion target n=1 Tax=Nocardioides mangrovi TaxID=2874580 RepID=A0ABS7UC98_9ACTN|nr:hypothetical protein [Nocardioides mangrovi]MBZ5738298.1 hypothetical protein [Nocardioides mangrovi]
MIRDTEIAGDPASISAVAGWLRDTLATGGTTYGDAVFSARSQASSAWTSEASAGFQRELKTLGSSTDGVTSAATTMATETDALATALTSAQGQMAEARATASSGGLTVTGTVIHGPGTAPPSVGALPADATPTEADAHDRAVATVDAYNAKVTAWNSAVATADAADQSWQQAIDAFTSTWQAKGDDITSMLQDLFTSAAEIGIQVRISRWFKDAEQAFKHDAQVWRQIARSYIDADGRFTGTDPDDYYEALRKADDLDIKASDAAKGADFEGSRLASKVGKGFFVLGVAATGWGIYQDMQDGESAAQATTSNVGGFLAGVGAGAAVGAAVGSIVPGPGTAVGAVAGAIVGTGVGIITSGAIDSMWENGVDSIGDVGDAVADGWGELTDTVGAVGDLAGDAGDAIGDGVSGAWHSVFG